MSILLDTETTHADEGFRPDDMWRAVAACRGLGTDLFFPEGRGGALRAQEATAKSICRDCPVVEQCQIASMEIPERHGIWGGLTEEERNVKRLRSHS